MSRLFISHSSGNDDWAIALKDWLVRAGWSGENDIFLDLDPERGIVAGQRWAHALEEAATRCEAVLFLVSEAWLASRWCFDEYQLAKELNKKLFALLIDDVPLERLPGGLTAQWQVVNLRGEPAERFLTLHPRTQHQSPVHIAKSGLASLKRGLEKAGIGAETFELQPDPNGPFGWRAPYRGLEALEPEDAAVFFGRNADMVRGIDALRGLAAHKPPRLIVILGASGAGKSSFLRAGLWPRLLRDDSQWLPLKPIRASRGGAIEGGEGLLAALEDAHARLALRTTRAALREKLATPGDFVALFQDLRQAAARRAHLSEPPYPLPVLCLDQGEELFAADAGAESFKLLQLARVAIDGHAALLLVTIRSDSYGRLQGAGVLAEVEKAVLSLDPVPQGEIGRIIREPSEVLRRKAGPQAPAFDPAVVERLQNEIAGEADALPLLAFVLQRLMREHHGAATIGVAELERTGGVAAAIECEAEAALADAGYGPDRAERRDVLRRLFIPRLCRIDRESRAPQRRVARQVDLPADLAKLARALTERRLLVVRVAGEAGRGETGAATLEVAHEALLRRWPTLAELLAKDRDALLMLDGVLMAANDWEKADAAHKQDFLAHRGSRLADAQALAARGTDWAREAAPAQPYLAACAAREAVEREEKEAALAREQARLDEIAAAQARTARLQQRGRWTLAGLAAVVALGLGVGIWQYRMNLERQAQLDQGQVSLIAELATSQRLQGRLDSALRLSVHAVRLESRLRKRSTATALARAALATALWQSHWRTMLGEHENIVPSAAFSPDGAHIVTASSDRTARVWKAATGTKIAVLRGHADFVLSAVFRPDGAHIVTASADKTARLWDAATGKEIAVLRGHADFVLSAVFRPDGARIVTASVDKTLRLWDAATFKEIAVLRGHENHVLSAVFSPDGARIVTASVDKTARVWDAVMGKEIAVLRGHESIVQSATFSRDGRRIVTASDDGTVRVWDAASGTEIAVLRGHQNYVQSAVFSPDGKRIVTASRDKTARVWDADTWKEIAVLRGHESYVQSAIFSPDGARIVTASWDKTARVWDADTWMEIAVLRGHGDAVTLAAFSPDGAHIVTASDDWTARVWDTAADKQIAVLRGHGDSVRSAAFSRDGGRIVTASEDRTARVWDAAASQSIVVLPGHEDRVLSAAFSPDSRRIVTASWDKTARVWDAATGQSTALLLGHEDKLLSAAFSPDGAHIVTASADETARVWHAVTGKEILLLRGHASPVLSAAFSPDGARLVTASWDQTARVWDAGTGKEIAVLRGHASPVLSAAFSPDGGRIVTASADGTARIWDVRVATMLAPQLVAEVCPRLLRGLTTFTRDEMRLAGYADGAPPIDVCAGIE